MTEVAQHPADARITDAIRPLIDIRRVFKRFGNHVAIDGISLELSSGRFVTFLGPSGCGKTTLLRMIGGLEQPDAGEILISGRSVAAFGAADRPTRMVFQSYALFPHMSVAQNVGYGLRVRGLSTDDIRARVTEQLELVGLTEKAAAYPNELSGGQQQRVALARALVTKPAVLLLDEPLAALDLKLRQRMQAELKALQRAAGITFIYVTHDQHEALALSDEIVVMQVGHVMQRGTPTDIYRRPVNRYVADFVGDATMIPAHVNAARDDGIYIDTPLGKLRSTAPVGAIEEGSDVTAVIRPEDVLLGVGSWNSLAGYVRETTYRGMDMLADLQIGDTILRVTVPGSQGAAVAPGLTIEVYIRESALWLIDARKHEKE